MPPAARTRDFQGLEVDRGCLVLAFSNQAGQDAGRVLLQFFYPGGGQQDPALGLEGVSHLGYDFVGALTWHFHLPVNAVFNGLGFRLLVSQTREVSDKVDGLADVVRQQVGHFRVVGPPAISGNVVKKALG